MNREVIKIYSPTECKDLYKYIEKTRDYYELEDHGNSYHLSFELPALVKINGKTAKDIVKHLAVRTYIDTIGDKSIDPATKFGASVFSTDLLWSNCGPQNSSLTYQLDTATPCTVPSSTVIHFGLCRFGSSCGPFLGLYNATLSATTNPGASGTVQVFYPHTTSPCGATSWGGVSVPVNSNLLKVCDNGYDTGSGYRTTLSALDQSTASYSWQALYLAIDTLGASTVNAELYYNTSGSKASTDIYRYLYQVVVGYS